jgi:hypothetical protein
MPALRFALLAVAIGCSTRHKPATPATAEPASTEAGTACEPGRCLDDISNAVKEHRPESRACYDAAAKQNPALQGGRLIINFRIDASGAVTETSQGMQDNQINDEAVIACVSDVIKRIKFATSPAGKATRAYHQFEFADR